MGEIQDQIGRKGTVGDLCNNRLIPLERLKDVDDFVSTILKHTGVNNRGVIRKTFITVSSLLQNIDIKSLSERSPTICNKRMLH